MRQPPVLIKSIRQKDNYSFTIEWTDGVSKDCKLSMLQENCPCAKCYDPATGKQFLSKEQTDPQVRAAYVRSVGRYALRVQFTSGCSRGIYSYALLRSWK